MAYWKNMRSAVKFMDNIIYNFNQDIQLATNFTCSVQNPEVQHRTVQVYAIS